VQRSRKKEIKKIDEVEKDAIILWTSSGSPLEVKNKLDAMGFQNISYLAFEKYTTLKLAPHPFFHDFIDDFKTNKKEYEWVYNLLEDAKSKETFTKVLNFKISSDYNFMQGFTNDHAGQYFDKELIPSINNIVFVDGGGYVGDTVSEVIKNFPDYKKIYSIEPIAQNLRIAKRDLAQHPNIEFINQGLSNKEQTLYFNEEKSFSTMFGSGTQSIEVNTLDNLIDEKVDYIKLDIEGAEQDAIDGAMQLIQKHTPILAICVYHKAQDWHKIPKKVLAINPNYKVYLRHYMEGIFESVMYFIPSHQS
jgi:FkbM family methyltransferase